MTPDFFNRSLVAAVAVLAVVGVIDSAVDDDFDSLAVFAMVILLSLGLVARMTWGRPGVPVRADLARWLHQRATDGGESIGQVADRALSAYRAELLDTGDPD
ncbi:MAG: hypothetical protein GWN79_17560 [Actinobacteria bacterium]|nr:hypothetical protein [Actinomycetota bacterium]NIS33808.1 hypothetical protein [Actinomycetota bacterium]NIT96923.1 hypothetical protein [Actinomycetota bacterium]NIU20768.1 hypothetical protein [Actinomycetota bacterium]NIU68638.1 hypothetical protein [Actinomycetota bacterium]